ncbi:flagellar biosynthesis protein FlhB [Allohahella sp. A8]|uniref:flagellar biosynthesis protein FlhB n=1 Tax=Allohahella sp. A8 TaxID=3141461 RepID=UPI000C0993E3|nr:flagellar biosynthesis protein FlhB [Hahellaceae bacterium]|tara:strand:+ start:76468 stop:77598 length:1131 start_codon:yes stop_codon:yes gene_type:complete
MSENDSSQEKTEEPTQRKIEKAREEGQLPRSRELATFAVLFAGCGGILMFGSFLITTMVQAFTESFTLDREMLFDTSAMFSLLGLQAERAAVATAPLLGVLLIAAIAGPIALGGWMFSVKALAFKGSRINPISGIKRMFSMKSLMELVKALAKSATIGTVGWLIISNSIDALVLLGREDPVAGMKDALEIVAWAFFALGCSTILIAIVDVPFQLYDNNKNLKMTMQEVKDEYKDTEGKPEVKRRIREAQMEAASRRMMQDVPKADVIITNPTHFAVALKYDSNGDNAPILLAKGGDFAAARIREIAAQHKIEIVSSPPLARSIYYHTEVGKEIPSGLYLAVAQVLAYVFQLREFRKGRGDKPWKVRDFKIPKDLQK